ncbi:MAG: flagellar hook assembly protein FlgD [Chromatiales bacterium]|nr:flagellar hook assembly protein FlgD [Chromatiales bacterium]
MITMPAKDTELPDLALRRETGRGNRNELDQQDFLKLMIAQFRNQDPFKPLDGAEFFGQMAQVSTVSGIADMNRSVARLSDSIYASQALQASTMVGRTVLAEGDFADLAPGQPVAAGFELPGATAGVTARIYSSSGELVRELQLGPQAAGFGTFSWDGLLANGAPAPADTYRFDIAMRTGNGEVPVAAYVGSRVDSVTLSGDGRSASISTSNGQSLLLTQVKAIM